MSENRDQVLRRKVQEKVAKYRAIAKENGISSADIDQCILEALKSRSKKSSLHCVASVLKKCLLGVIFLSTLFIVFGFLISCHKPTQQYVNKWAFNSSYSILRVIRLATLPITRKFDISRLYYTECIIPNPLFSQEEGSCIPCEDVNNIPVLREVQDFTSTHQQHSGPPFVYKDLDGRRFSFDEMKSWFLKHKSNIRFGRGDTVDSSNPFVQSLSDLFTEERTAEDIQRAPFSLTWRTVSAGTVRFVRNFCGKPIFVPSDSEVQPEMFTIIESSSSHAHSLPKPSISGNAWLSQASGSREILLTPVPHCHGNCSEVSVILQAGDVLYFDSNVWHPSSLPFGDDISIACIGSYL